MKRLTRSIFSAICISLFSLPLLAQQFTDQTATRFPSPGPNEYSNQASLGDLEGDGDLDIVFANGGGFGSPSAPELVRVYINNGSGTFTDQSVARTGGLTGRHRGVEMGDCDRDGDLDIVLAQDFDSLPNLLINNGSGFFSSEGATRLPNIVLSSSRAQFGDTDNDGDLDLFFTSGAGSRFGCGQYRVYENDGTCHYTDVTATNFPIGNVCNNMDAIFGDIDGDFDIDIRTASTGTNNSRLYRNDGTGAFSEVAGVPADATCYSYDFGDIDGDGDLDLLGVNAASGSSAELLLENDGTGAYSNISGQISPNPSQDDNDSKFFDFDNDGDLDLLIAKLGGGAEKLYRNNGAGEFAQVSGQIQLIGTGDSSLDVVVGDLNGDGSYDFVTAQGESGSFLNRIYINSGPADSFPPTIVQTEQYTDADDVGPYTIRVAILDQMTSDRNFFDHGVQLNYSVDNGPDLSVDMLHSGGQIYRGEIPGQAGGSSVDYWVTASDFNDNMATGGTMNFVVPICDLVNDCSGNGACVGNQICECDSGWEGPDCSIVNLTGAGTIDPSPGINFRSAPGSAFRLFWNVGCGADDIDYAVYQGTIDGVFQNHEPLVCTTNNVRNIVFTPDAGNLYFLVVPQTENAEGSYGLDSDLLQRSPSVSACHSQAVSCQ